MKSIQSIEGFKGWMYCVASLGNVLWASCSDHKIRVYGISEIKPVEKVPEGKEKEKEATQSRSRSGTITKKRTADASSQTEFRVIVLEETNDVTDPAFPQSKDSLSSETMDFEEDLSDDLLSEEEHFEDQTQHNTEEFENLLQAEILAKNLQLEELHTKLRKALQAIDDIQSNREAEIEKYKEMHFEESLLLTNIQLLENSNRNLNEQIKQYEVNERVLLEEKRKLEDLAHALSHPPPKKMVSEESQTDPIEEEQKKEIPLAKALSHSDSQTEAPLLTDHSVGTDPSSFFEAGSQTEKTTQAESETQTTVRPLSENESQTSPSFHLESESQTPLLQLREMEVQTEEEREKEEEKVKVERTMKEADTQTEKQEEQESEGGEDIDKREESEEREEEAKRNSIKDEEEISDAEEEEKMNFSNSFSTVGTAAKEDEALVLRCNVCGKSIAADLLEEHCKSCVLNTSAPDWEIIPTSPTDPEGKRVNQEDETTVREVKYKNDEKDEELLQAINQVQEKLEKHKKGKDQAKNDPGFDWKSYYEEELRLKEELVTVVISQKMHAMLRAANYSYQLAYSQRENQRLGAVIYSTRLEDKYQSEEEIARALLGNDLSFEKLANFRICGWLSKRSDTLKVWNRRFFVLVDKFLIYYLKRKPGQQPRQVCILNSVSIKDIPESNISNKPFGFRVNTSKHEYILMAISEKERKLWTEQIQRASNWWDATALAPQMNTQLIEGTD